MKAFLAACVILALTLTATVINDAYFTDVCKEIESSVENGGYDGAKKALESFKHHEFILKLSVDNGYINEAKVSLESLIAAYQCDDGYEITRYIRDTAIRMERVRKSLVI